MIWVKGTLLCLLYVCLAGCASTHPDNGFSDAQKSIETRISKRVQWNQSIVLDQNTTQTVKSILERELSADDAVQIALLNNPSLQAFFENLGISQADLIQAGLLSNPVFSGRARFPDRSPHSTNTEFSISQNFVDIFLRPVRQKLAKAQYEQVKLQVADRILELSNQVQAAYYRLQAQIQITHLLETRVAASQLSVEMIQRQYVAGNINDLDLANEQATFHQNRLELAQEQSQIELIRTELASLMGLWGKQTNWKIAPELAAIPKDELPLDNIEAVAIANRFDLAAAKQQMQIVADALELARKGIISSVEVAIDTEHGTDGTNVTGPSIELPLPIFDYRQAQIKKLEIQMRQSKYTVDSLAIRIRSEVDSIASNLLARRQIVQYYKNTIIPLRTQILALNQEQYNAMVKGVYDLLVAKELEISAQRGYIEALRDYWILRAQLERALGGSRLLQKIN